MFTKNMFVLSAVTLGFTSTAFAEHHQFRNHDAHQHGVVEWHIAQDGEELLAEITAPGSDIVGFEHAPENAEQKSLIKQAMATLENPAVLFAVNAEAGCVLEAHNVVNTLTADESDDHDDHDSHDHDEHHDHDSDEHADHKDHDEHSDHNKKASHGEFTAQYTFHCKQPNNVKTVTTDWFNAFGNTEKISVQAITDKGVSAAELSPASNIFLF